MRKTIQLLIVLMALCAFSIQNIAIAQDLPALDNTNNDLSVTVVKNESAKRYVLAPGDIFSFSVYDEPTLTQPEIIVRPDGYATIEPIGEIYVEGYDIAALTSMIKEKMLYFIRDPQISINIQDFHPASIYIYGAVQKPGDYQQIIQANKGATDTKNPIVKTDLTLSNVISNAGGLTFDADLTKVLITSKDGKQKEVDLWKLIKDGDTSQNVKLSSGDTVYIPKSDSITIGDDEFQMLISASMFPSGFPVRVIGEVSRAGVYNIATDSPYINSAIALASGYTIDANRHNVVIYRKTSANKISQIVVDPKKIDFVLRPNDLVEVPGRKSLKVIRAADYASKLMSPLYGPAVIYNNWADVFNPGRTWRSR